jgi:hypothetical protein
VIFFLIYKNKNKIMKHLKKFKLFENDSFNTADMNVIGTYGPDEHEEFCEAAHEWNKKTGIGNNWSLWALPPSWIKDQSERVKERKLKRGITNPNPKFSMDSDYWDLLERARRYWNMYVKDDKKMSLVEMGDSLFAVLHDDNEINMAYNHEDRKVADTSIFQGLL